MSDTLKQFDNDYSVLGNGYRNVFYSTIKNDDGEKVGQITLMGYDTDGRPTTFHFPYRVSVAYHTVGDSSDTGEVDLYDQSLRRKYFNTAYERRQWLKSMDDASSLRIMEALPPEDCFIMDAFRKRIYDDDYNQLPLRVYFFDIEIAVENEFPYPEQSAYPINVITILDSIDKQYYSWVVSANDCKNTLGEYDGCKVNLFKFGDEKLRVDLEYRFAKGEITQEQLDEGLKKSLENEEKKMLRHFITWMTKHRPDVMSGWNSRAYDMPYIVRRSEKVLGKKWSVQLCPGGYYREKKLIFEDDGNGENKKPDRNNTVYIMPGLSQMDLQVLYRDKFKIRSALDGGYGLNNVSLVELDDEKVKHEESFNNFWKVNFQKYWEYNIQDVSLVYRLEQKLGLITQARVVTSIGSTNMDSIYQSINYIMQALAMFSSSKFGKTWKTYQQGGRRKGDKYTGAFVFDVQPGVFRYGEATVDFNSLYPNTDRAINLSPETKMGVVFGDWDNPDEQLYIVPNELVWNVSPEAKQKILMAQAMGQPGIKISRKALAKLLDETCACSVAITRKSDGMIYHVLFKKYELQKGIFSEWLGFFFDRRKALKKLRGEYEDKADARKKELVDSGVTDEHSIKHDPEFEKWDNLESRYDNLQQATKILINSAYGTLGTPSSPIYDVDLAETTTLNGQFTNKSAAKQITKIYQERFGAPEGFVPQLSGDTDSVTGDMKVRVYLTAELRKRIEKVQKGQYSHV